MSSLPICAKLPVMIGVLVMSGLLFVHSATAAAAGGSDSSSNRSGSLGQVNASVGFGGPDVINLRAAAGLNLGSFLVPEVSYTAVPLGGHIGDTWTGQGLRLMLFPGNSLYLAGGLEKRVIWITHPNDTLNNGSITTKEVIKDTIQSVAIGNRWQWSGFIFGVEWLGYYKRISVESKKQRTYVDNHLTNEEAWSGSDTMYDDGKRVLQFVFGTPF